MTGKTVLITGCSSGFGKLLVQQFLERGHTVIATMRRADERRELFSAELEKHPQSLKIHELDVCSSEQRQAMVELIDRDYGGRLDVLVNNAGFGVFGALEEIDEDSFRQQFEVNVFGLTFLTRALLPAIRQSQGSLVFLSSLMGFGGFPLSSAYCASKFAVSGLAESLYYELQPFNVQVILIEPGGHRTDFGKNIQWASKPASAAAEEQSAEAPYRKQTQNFQNLFQRLMSGTGTSPEPVARRIVYMVENRSKRLHVPLGTDAITQSWAIRFLPQSIRLWIFGREFRKLFLKEPEALKDSAS